MEVTAAFEARLSLPVPTPEQAERMCAFALSACADHGKWVEATRLLDDLKGRAVEGLVKPPALALFNQVARALARAGEWEQSERFFEEVRGLTHTQPDAETHFQRIMALERGGQRAASATLAAFEEALFSTDEAMVVALYRAALRACAHTPEVVGPVLRGGRLWERARAVLDDLHHSRRITPTVECMNALLSALESGGQYETVEPTVSEMKGAHDFTPSPDTKHQ